MSEVQAEYVIDGKQITVLDKGYVSLINSMGDDDSIADTARVSYRKGTKQKRDNEKLIDYLIKNKHTSPLEFVEFVFKIKAPLFVVIHLLRHRTASVSSESARFSVIEDDFYIPMETRLQKQHSTNKQSSSNEVVERPELLQKTIECNALETYANYEFCLSQGLSRELSRMNLPQNVYVTINYKMDLNNLFKFLKLRLAKDCQYETREYAKAMYGLIKPIVPLACSSFEDHILHAVTISRSEIQDILECKISFQQFLRKKNYCG